MLEYSWCVPMSEWLSQVASAALVSVSHGDLTALAGLFLVAALGEVGIPFPFLVDTVVFLTSYQSGPLSFQVALVLLMLLLGRQSGAAGVYWVTRSVGPPAVNWFTRRFPSFGHDFSKMSDRLNRKAPLALVIARLTPGLLTLTSVASGAMRTRYLLFVLGVGAYSIIADGVLAVSGFLAGLGIELSGLEASFLVVAAGLIATIAVLAAVYHFWLRRRWRW